MWQSIAEYDVGNNDELLEDVEKTFKNLLAFQK